MTEHILRMQGPYWDAVAKGIKNFDIRRDDRGFQRGDILILHRLEPNGYHLTMDGFGWESKPKEIRKRITYILTGGQLGIEPGYVIMALKDE